MGLLVMRDAGTAMQLLTYSSVQDIPEREVETMLIVMSKKHTEVHEEMKRRLICAIWDYAEENGISYNFVMDSKIIQDSIGSISSRLAHLSESVWIDKDLIKMRKESKEFEKKINEDEIKTAMKNMSKVDRKLRKVKKNTQLKSNGDTKKKEVIK